jgi:hypothetical protein
MFLPVVLAPFLLHLISPIVSPGVVAPAVLWADEDDEAYKYEYAGADESPEFHFGVEVLYQEAAADEYEDQPGAASEIMTEAEEEADGYEEDVPAEEPVGEGETHLV